MHNPTMVCWHGFWDESGDKDYSRVLALGGYIFLGAQKERFSRNWRAMLQRNGLSHAHMVELSHRRGQFADWSPAQAHRFLVSAVSLIRAHASFGVCTLLATKRFRHITFDNGYKVSDGYAAAMALAFRMTAMELGWMKFTPGDSALITLEAGHSSQSLAYKTMADLKNKNAREGLVSFQFMNKAEPGLQAADLLCYLARKYVIDLADGTRPPRKDLQALLQLPTMFTYVSADELTEMPTQEYLPSSYADKIPAGVIRKEQQHRGDWALNAEQRDRYVKALFGSGSTADAELKSIRDWYDQRGSHPSVARGYIADRFS